jgi:hypothetical protein
LLVADPVVGGVQMPGIVHRVVVVPTEEECLIVVDVVVFVEDAVVADQRNLQGVDPVIGVEAHLQKR